MSQTEHDSGQQSPIKTSKSMIIALALLAVVLVIALLWQFAANIRSIDKDSPAMSNEAVAKRLKPVGELTLADAGGAAAKGAKSGEEVYKSVCSVCHAGGVAGAPKLGDKAGWASRVKEGQKRLVEIALKGEGAMPARGGNAELSDLEVERAVVYMANQAGAKFKERAAPAPGMTAASASEKTTASASEKNAAPAPIAAIVDGKKIYESTCAVCHAAGVAGAPKIGDKATWALRLKSGTDVLYASALKGKGAMMPAKGGNPALSDADVKAAVDYLVSQAK